MLAGPKTYAFGTKIYFPDIGVGTVDDRGGAIVSSGSRGYDADRIDIWMGSGDEGLRRALTWGKRTITGKIIPYDISSELSPISLENFTVGKVNTAKYQTSKTPSPTPVESPSTKEQPIQEIDIFTVSVYKNSTPETIKRLQEVLKSISYYMGDIDGKYSDALEQAVYNFQIENQVIVSKKDKGAGYYGVKTRARLKEVYARFQENEQKRIAEEAKIALAKAEELKKQEEETKEVALFIQDFGNPKAEEVGVHVRRLQQSLKLLGYFSYKDTAIFGPKTREALIHYQEDKGIDSEEFGHIGKATKIALLKDLMELKKQQNNILALNTK